MCLGFFLNLSQIYDSQSFPLKSRFAGVYAFQRVVVFYVTTSKRWKNPANALKKKTQQN